MALDQEEKYIFAWLHIRNSHWITKKSSRKGGFSSENQLD